MNFTPLNKIVTGGGLIKSGMPNKSGRGNKSGTLGSGELWKIRGAPPPVQSPKGGTGWGPEKIFDRFLPTKNRKKKIFFFDSWESVRAVMGSLCAEK